MKKVLLAPYAIKFLSGELKANAFFR